MALLLHPWITAPVHAGGDVSPSGEAAPFFFVVIADTQLGWAARDRDFEIEEANFARAIEAINRLNPPFAFVCGDLVNKPGDPEQIAAFQRLMKGFSGEFPVYLASGNHDVTGAPTPESLATYRGIFGPDRFTFEYGNSRFLVLNSSILAQGKHVPDEVAEQFEWTRTELERAKSEGVRNIFVVQHHPWFLESADEPPQIMSLRPDVRKPYLELFEEYGVRATFAGHAHRNALGRHGSMEMITTASITPPFSGEPAGIRIVRISGESIEHEYFALEDIPSEVAVEENLPLE
jgi:3',5'-cyclic AMP phosphodiesterase CpdA